MAAPALSSSCALCCCAFADLSDIGEVGMLPGSKEGCLFGLGLRGGASSTDKHTQLVTDLCAAQPFVAAFCVICIEDTGWTTCSCATYLHIVSHATHAANHTHHNRTLPSAEALAIKQGMTGAASSLLPSLPTPAVSVRSKLRPYTSSL